MAGDDYNQLIEQALEELQRKTDNHIARGLLSEEIEYWQIDQRAGTIIFTHADGMRVAGPVQFIGTYSMSQGTWRWSWGNLSILPPLRVHARRLRDYGAQHDLLELTTEEFECAEDDCWTFAALACHLNNTQGAYHGPTDGRLSFVTFGELAVLTTA